MLVPAVGTHFQYILVLAVVGYKHAVGSLEKIVNAAIADLVATDINQQKDFCMSE